MGIIKGIIEYVAADGLIAAADAAKKGLDKASEAAEKNLRKSCRSFWMRILITATCLFPKFDINSKKPIIFMTKINR